MTENEKIAPTTTVREVMTKYPQAVEVFAKYGLTGCGGAKGPIEPVGFFATVHQVDADTLLRELNEIAAKGEVAAGPSQVSNETGPELYKPFVRAAMVVALTVGCSLGAVNLAAMALGGTVGTGWAALTQAHGNAQIFGWVGLFIMGIAYHVLPRLKATTLQAKPLAQASFWLVLVGLSLRVLAQPFSVNPMFASLVVVSAVMEFAGAVFFAYVAARTLASSSQPHDFYEKYILASPIWFAIFAGLTVALSVYTAVTRVDLIPKNFDVPYLHIGLLGFVGMMVFGFALRTVPLFMGLKTPNKRAFDVIFWAINLGIVVSAGTELAVAAFGWGDVSRVSVWGALVEYAGVAAFVYYLNIFRKPAINISEAGVERGYERFIKVGFLWLLIAGTMSFSYAVYTAFIGLEVPHSLVGAYRHALTVGFISMMILGMSARIVPVFAGVRLFSGRLLVASFILINTGNLLRVLSQPLADFVGGPFFVTMGISGFFEVTALALFGYNLWRTMDSPIEEELPAESSEPASFVTAEANVGDLIESYPETLSVFVKHGFVHLENEQMRRTMAKSVTVAMASQAHAIDLRVLLDDLNAVVADQSQRVPTAA